MEKFNILILILFVHFSIQSTVVLCQDQHQTFIAVMDLEASEMSNSAKIALSNIVRKELIKSGLFTVVERNRMDEILQEQGFQQSGACNELTCLVRIGRILGVQKIIGGSIGQLGKKYIIDLMLINVETRSLSDLEYQI